MIALISSLFQAQRPKLQASFQAPVAPSSSAPASAPHQNLEQLLERSPATCRSTRLCLPLYFSFYLCNDSAANQQMNCDNQLDQALKYRPDPLASYGSKHARSHNSFREFPMKIGFFSLYSGCYVLSSKIWLHSDEGTRFYDDSLCGSAHSVGCCCRPQDFACAQSHHR